EETVSDAKNKVNQTADKIITDLKKLGIADKDIKTTDYSINPNYSNEVVPVMGGSGQQAITGYTVTQNLEVKVKPIDKANKVVDTATADGANLVGGINFTFSDDLQKTLDQQATQQAVNDAKDKAQSLANVSGIHLGKIVNVVENSNQPRPLMMSAGIAGSNAVQTSTPPTNVTPGENSLTVDVVLYYETY
ncbi:MAG TPA: SIMPL domain-containing protein, partial [Patescibacteria group bacterium]|nr:SIMPL domain-containing protein [Patescibacteria group bacterium]